MTIKEVRNRKGLLFSENGEIVGLKQIYVAFGVVVVIDENCIIKAKHLTSETTNYINLGQFDEDADFIENGNRTMGMVNTITGLRSNGKSEAFDAMQRREELLRYLSSELASKIDTKL